MMFTRRVSRLFYRLAILATLILIFLSFIDRFIYPVIPNNRFSSEIRKLYESPTSYTIRDLKIKSCGILSSCTEPDMEWYRIPKDLTLGGNWRHKMYLFVRRTPSPEHIEEKIAEHEQNMLEKLGKKIHAEFDFDVITDIFIGKIPPIEIKPSSDDSASSIDNKPVSSGWHSRGHNIWVKFGKYDRKIAVTAATILYGSDAVDPRPGWRVTSSKKNNNNLLNSFANESGKNNSEDDDNDKIHDSNTYDNKIENDGFIENSREARISFRVGPRKAIPDPPTLRLNANGGFKILQAADLHERTGEGACEDPFPVSSTLKTISDNGCSNADGRTNSFFERILDEEKPDLVAFTGDQINGQGTVPDAQTALFKALAPVVSRKIPFIITFGNHDDEGDLNREQQLKLIQQMPGNLARRGPEGLSGIGNYYVTVLAPKNDHVAITLWVLDSHSYSQSKTNPGYDYIKDDQLQFILDTGKSGGQLMTKQKAYTHFPLSLAFFHIPTPEYRNISSPFVGEYREASTASRYNPGTIGVLSRVGVSVVSVGHDHVNDFCMYNEQDFELSPYSILYKQGQDEHEGDIILKNSNKLKNEKSTRLRPPMWLCHGGGGGFGGYGGYGGWIRRMRIFEIDTLVGKIKTWKRLENSTLTERLDEMLLVEEGKVVSMTRT